jgi:hypothetical protein
VKKNKDVVTKVSEDHFLSTAGDEEVEIPFSDNGVEDVPIEQIRENMRNISMRTTTKL